MRIYGERETTTKVFLLLNKALSKFSNRFAIDLPKHKLKKAHHGLTISNDYYNDMGISMFDYIAMLNKLTTSKRRHKSLISNIEFGSSPDFERSNVRSRLVISHSKEIKRQVSKSLFSKLSHRSIKRIHDRHLRELRICKMDMENRKTPTNKFMEIAKQLMGTDLMEESSMGIEESLRLTLNLFNNCLSQRHDISSEFINLVEYTCTVSEEKPSNMKIDIVPYGEDLTVALMTPREIILVNPMYDPLVLSMKFQLFFICFEYGKKNPFSSLGPLLHSRFKPPKDLRIMERNEGFLVEEASIDNWADNFISNVVIPDICVRPYAINAIGFRNDSEKLVQRFLKDRIAQQLMLHGESDNSTATSDRSLRSQLTTLYSDIISEVIQYPKEENNVFEYTLELNPRSSRHRILLDGMGLLKLKHHIQLEVLAPNDYKLRFFFLKEIFNPNGRGVVIKLHKLSPKNHIYKLILEENTYIQSLSTTNKSVWCTEVTASFNFDLINLVYNLGKMYLQKVNRAKEMKIEATTFNCSELSIQRYYFSKEIVESLGIFANAYH